MSAQEAADRSLQYMEERVGGLGGMIGITKGGDVGVGLSMKAMSYAYIKLSEDKLHWGVEKGEDFLEQIAIKD